jgi:hypothetical protein
VVSEGRGDESAVDVERSAVGGVRHATVARRLGVESGSFRSAPKIIMRSKDQIIMVSRYAARLLVAQRMSTGPSGD